MYASEFQELLPLVVFLIVIYGSLIVVGLASYIIQGVAILKQSRSRGLRNGWLGFIPYGKEYQLGKIAGEIEIRDKHVTNPGLWMALLPFIVSSAFGIIYGAMISSMLTPLMQAAMGGYYQPDITQMFSGQFYISMVLMYIVLLAGGVLIQMVRLLALHRIYASYYNGQRPVFYLIMSIFVPLAEPIILIRLSKRPMINPPQYMLYPEQPYPPQQGYPQYPQQPYYGDGQYNNGYQQQPYMPPEQPYAPPEFYPNPQQPNNPAPPADFAPPQNNDDQQG